jgi:hypothetical protein
MRSQELITYIKSGFVSREWLNFQQKMQSEKFFDLTPNSNAGHIRAMMLSLNQIPMNSEGSTTLDTPDTKSIIFNENLYQGSKVLTNNKKTENTNRRQVRLRQKLENSFI